MRQQEAKLWDSVRGGDGPKSGRWHSQLALVRPKGRDPKRLDKAVCRQKLLMVFLH